MKPNPRKPAQTHIELAPPRGVPPASSGLHLATISYHGRFWDVYIELEEDARTPATWRGRLCFSAADPGDHEPPARTTAIIVEESFEAAIARAQALEERQLAGLLRSCLPD